jgi:hypothetical protein
MARRRNEGAVMTLFHSPKTRSGTIAWLLMMEKDGAR